METNSTKTGVPTKAALIVQKTDGRFRLFEETSHIDEDGVFRDGLSNEVYCFPNGATLADAKAKADRLYPQGHILVFAYEGKERVSGFDINRFEDTGKTLEEAHRAEKASDNKQ